MASSSALERVRRELFIAGSTGITARRCADILGISEGTARVHLNTLRLQGAARAQKFVRANGREATLFSPAPR